MIKPGEHKTVQARILAYAQEIGWTYVPRGEAEKRRGFDQFKASPAEQAADTPLLFKAAGADKPTVLVLIDRNELEDQMLRNLARPSGTAPAADSTLCPQNVSERAIGSFRQVSLSSSIPGRRLCT